MKTNHHPESVLGDIDEMRFISSLNDSISFAKVECELMSLLSMHRIGLVEDLSETDHFLKSIRNAGAQYFLSATPRGISPVIDECKEHIDNMIVSLRDIGAGAVMAWNRGLEDGKKELQERLSQSVR